MPHVDLVQSLLHLMVSRHMSLEGFMLNRIFLAVGTTSSSLFPRVRFDGPHTGSRLAPS